MNPKQRLEDAINWTKQAGDWLNENHPKLAQATEPVMAKTSVDLGYWMSAHELIQATQAPVIIQTALYTAALAGKEKFNGVFLSEVDRALKEYNSRQSSGSTFNWAKSLALLGTASLALSTASDYLEADSNGRMLTQTESECVAGSSLQNRPKNDTLRMIIREPIDEIIEGENEEEAFEILNDSLEPNYDTLEENFLSLREDNVSILNLRNIAELRSKLEANLEKQDFQELQPRVQEHYDLVSQGHNYQLTLEKFARAQEYDNLIKKYAEEEDIPYTMMFALIINESAGEERAKSHAGARGLMQIMPKTAEWFQEDVLNERYSRSALYDAEKNIGLGAKYLAFLHGRVEKMFGDYDRFQLDEEELWDLTMACYNRGFGGMMGSLQDPERVGRAVKAQEEGSTVPIYSFWSLKKGETTDEAFRYVAKIRGIEELYVGELQKR